MPEALVLAPEFVVLLFLLAAVGIWEVMLGPLRTVGIPIPRAPTWGQIISGFGSLVNRQITWFDNAFWPMVRATWAWQNSHQRFLAGIGVHSEATNRAIFYITGTRLPAVASHADAHADANHRAALLRIDQVDASATVKANAAQVRSETYAQQVGAAVDADARQLAVADAQLARQLAQQSEAFSSQLHAQALGFATEVGADANAYSRQLALQEQAFTQQVGTEAEAFTKGVAQDLERYIESVGKAAAADTRAVTGAAVAPLAGALALAQTAIRTLENSKCQQFCNSLGNLGAGLEAIDLAALLALVAEAAHDPGTVAKFISGTIAPLVSEGVSEAASAFGVQL